MPSEVEASTPELLASLEGAPRLRSGNRISESSRSSLSVSQAVEALSAATRNDAPAVVASLLDRLDAAGRYAFLTLALGGMRVGVDRQSVVSGKSRAVRVDLGGSRILKKKKK